MRIMQAKIWRSVVLWLLQRITAVLLVALLGLHLWASNFATNWASVLHAGIDISLLAVALFHGLNGVRTVLLDFGLGPQARKFLSVSLWILGFVAFLFGTYGIWPLLFPS